MSESDEYLDWADEQGCFVVDVKLLARGSWVKPIRVGAGRADELVREGKTPRFVRVDGHGLHATVQRVSADRLVMQEVDLRVQFLHDELFALSFQGMVQRNSIYCKDDGLSEREREAIRQSWRARVSTLVRGLERHAMAEMDDAEFVSYLRQKLEEANDWPETQRALCAKDPAAPSVGHWRVGAFQKLVNLWLKYQWCQAGDGVAPPHFPVDALILKHIQGFHDLRWTQMDDWRTYAEVVAAARVHSVGEPLAMWELRMWKSS